MTTDMGRLLPEGAATRVREFLASGEAPPQPKDAATTILLRPGDDGPEVFFLRRRKGMAFAGGMLVFPGGGVDPRDVSDDVPWAGPSPEQWAQRLGVDVDLARGLVCAAARELFEEAGVLLAGPDATTLVVDPGSWDDDRRRLEAREVAFSAWLRERGLVLRTDLLTAWSCWITPEFEPKRYVTRFFAVALPEGQQAREGSTESDGVVWMPAAEATAAAGESVAMLPPQYVTCRDVARHGDVAAALGAAAAATPPVVMPVAVDRGDDGVELRVPL